MQKHTCNLTKEHIVKNKIILRILKMIGAKRLLEIAWNAVESSLRSIVDDSSNEWDNALLDMISEIIEEILNTDIEPIITDKNLKH